MRIIDRLRLRLRSLVRRERVERDLHDEMRFHLEELTWQGIEKGLTQEEAYADALRQFGGVAQVQEDCRDKRHTRRIEEFAADVRYALRLFAKSPGFTAVALLSLALGIGANTAIFTLVETVILRELPVPEPGALVQIVGVVPGQPSAQGSFSYPTFQWLREKAPMFSHLFTWSSHRIEAGEGEGMEWIAVDRVSEDYFAGLGVSPLLGRTLADEKQQPAVAVLSHSWWRKRFHSDPSALGRTIRLGGIPFTIVGVMPEEFFGPVVGSSPDIYIPLAAEVLLDPEIKARFTARNSSWLTLMARLRPGVTLPQAEAGLQPLWPALLEETGPLDRDGNMARWFRELKGRVQPASTGISQLRRRFRQPLGVLVVVAGIVLLIACVNLSNFLLARSITRQREIALRLAVGAGRGRVLRQMLTESLLIAAGGAALGLLFAIWSSKLLTSLLSTSRDTISLNTNPNATLLAYSAAVTILTTLLFGLAPALRALRASVHPLLKERSHQVTGPRASRALLVTQVALSLLLVAGATLFLRTFQNLLSVNLGFSPDRVLVASVEPERVGLKGEATFQYYRVLQVRLQNLPGVESVSFSWMTPIQNCCWWETLIVDGYTPAPGERTDVFLNSIAPGFFRTTGTRLLRGRDFDSRDVSNSRPVAIVNESFTKKFFPNGDVIGRTISLPPNYKVGTMEIVGIVEDARYIDLRGPTRLAAYFPLAQSSERLGVVEVLVRTAGSPLALASAVRGQVHAFHPAMPVRFRSLAQEVEGVLTYERLLAWLSAFFGGIALALAAIGLYGTISYSVSRRTSEIGVRVALGASRATVLWLVMRQSLTLVIAGLALGCAAAVYLTRFVEALLFGVKPTDPLTFAIAASVLGAVAVFAAWLPARRAAAIDPMIALRYE